MYKIFGHLENYEEIYYLITQIKMAIIVKDVLLI